MKMEIFNSVSLVKLIDTLCKYCKYNCVYLKFNSFTIIIIIIKLQCITTIRINTVTTALHSTVTYKTTFMTQYNIVYKLK